MSKLLKLEREAQRIRDRIDELNGSLREIEKQRVEQENLQIIQMIRALRLSPAELHAFLADGALPSSLDSAKAGTVRRDGSGDGNKSDESGVMDNEA